MELNDVYIGGVYRWNGFKIGPFNAKDSEWIVLSHFRGREYNIKCLKHNTPYEVGVITTFSMDRKEWQPVDEFAEWVREVRANHADDRPAGK
jgi:hypothetical protein